MPSNRSRVRVLPALVGGAAALAILGLGATAASAHVDPDPLAIAAGTSGDVSFTLEHGCDGSPTTKLEIKVPADFTAVSAPDKAGWTATVADDVITWVGGPLDAATAEAFTIALTAPSTPGSYEFPAVQTCEQGTLSWVEKPVDGQPEPDHPTPVLKVTDGPPTSEDLVSDEEAATDETASSDGATSDAAGTDTTAPVVIAPAPSVADTTKQDDSNTGGVIAGIVAAVVVIGGGAAFALSRKRKGSTGAR